MNLSDVSTWLHLSDAERNRHLCGPDRCRWIEVLARYGFAEAQTLLGQLLLDRRPSPSYGTAFGWFVAAAQAGHCPAINMMGRCLEHGWDTKADPVAATACYRRAATAGYDWSQFNLGCALLYGIGTARDRRAAFGWFRCAADQGLAKADNMLGRFHEQGWDRPVSRLRAARHYRAAAEGGDFRGQFNLASLLLQQGRIAEAVTWTDRAIETGSPDFLVEAAAQLAINEHAELRALSSKASCILTGCGKSEVFVASRAF